MTHGDEPLRPTRNVQKPPWVSLWAEYKGRPDWFTELGQENRHLRAGRFAHWGPRTREEDPDWFDRAVSDGTSLAGAFGRDSVKYPNMSVKGDHPQNLREFQENVMKGSHQYKQIAEKWEFSKEHPGVDVNPTLDRLTLTVPSHLGTKYPASSDLVRESHVAKSRPVAPWDRQFDLTFFNLTTAWPRFFDKPMNEGCFEKTLACMKYAALFALPAAAVSLRLPDRPPHPIFGRRFHFSDLFRTYLRLLPVPCVVAGSWGFTMCTAATIRNKDDIYNHFYASAAVGAVVATIKNNIPLGLSVAFASVFFGTFWHYQRLSELGLQWRAVHPRQGQALSWKLYQFGDNEYPDETF